MYSMVAWVVIFSFHSCRSAHCRHAQIPSSQLLLFRALTNRDARNPFGTPPLRAVLARRIRSYENCRVQVRLFFCGTQFSPVSHTRYFSLPLISFLFSPLRTLLRSCKPQLFCFQRLPHSLRKNTRGGGTPRFTERKHFNSHVCVFSARLPVYPLE
jgi:hypothetical protein